MVFFSVFPLLEWFVKYRFPLPFPWRSEGQPAWHRVVNNVGFGLLLWVGSHSRGWGFVCDYLVMYSAC